MQIEKGKVSTKQTCKNYYQLLKVKQSTDCVQHFKDSSTHIEEKRLEVTIIMGVKEKYFRN